MSVGVKEFQYSGGDLDVTTEMHQVYAHDGAFIVKNLLDEEEIKQIFKTFDMNEVILKSSFGVADGRGRASRLTLWSHPGNDPTGMVVRCNKVAGTCEQLLGGEAYHYHTKVLLKDAKTGGAHLWHQDYGYWYKNGCLRPDMLSVFIPLDKCRRENGCLQVVPGTHRCGRIEHDIVHGQTVANQERVDQILKHFPLIYCEMDPGDALFFHCNLLHTSAGNDSDQRRWVFIASYNKADNDPVYKHHHPNYTPLHKVGNNAIKECREYTNMEGKEFADPATDETISTSAKK